MSAGGGPSARGIAVRGLVLAMAATLMVTLSARHLAPMPDLVIVVASAAALRHGPWVGAGLGLIGGWALDLLPPGSEVAGLQALLYAASLALIGRLHRPGPIPLTVAVGATAVAALLVAGGRAVVALTLGEPVDVQVLTGQVLATTIVAALLMPLLLRLESGPRRRRRTA